MKISRFISVEDLAVGDAVVFHTTCTNRIATVLRCRVMCECVNLWMFDGGRVQRWTPYVGTPVTILKCNSENSSLG